MITHASTLLAASQSAPPAGGGETSQVVFGTIGATIVTAAMFALVFAHRSGRTQILRRAAEMGERRTGLPGWCSVPLGVLTGSLVVAVFGMYWDIATHLDSGRDPGPFANTSHYFILAGLFGIFLSGLIAVFMPEERPSRSAVRVPSGWYAPLGGVLILVCSFVSLSAFPLDDIWHRIFGQDVTLYGPTHLVLFGGAGLSVLGGLVLLTEGRRSLLATGARSVAGDGAARDAGAGTRRVMMAGFAGAFLIALSTFQGEYDYAVPQFNLVLHPVLLMIAGSVALVTARAYVGRGGALAAALFFIVLRGALTLLVSPLFGHTTLHFPLYLVEAGLVELVALRVDPRRTIRFGLIAGALIGTIGLAAEWAWSYAWWTIHWPASLLPEAAICGFVAAVAGGVLGSLIGNGLLPDRDPARRPKLRAAALAGAAIIAVLVYVVPVTDGPAIRANVQLADVTSPPNREVMVTARLQPPDAADNANWFVTTAWQGKEGRSVVDPMKEISPGVWRSPKPVPVYGSWKASLRLHKGNAIQGLPLYFPSDPAIPAKAIPAKDRFERTFVRDKKLLQREQKPGVPGALTTIAYLAVLLVAALLIAALTAGLVRLARSGTPRPSARFTRGETAVGTPAEPRNVAGEVR